mgnify:CR=1 FL=1
MFRHIFFFLLSCTALFANPFFDRFLIFGSYNIERDDDYSYTISDYYFISGGMLVMKEFAFPAYNIKDGRVSGFAKSAENIDGNSSGFSGFHELYARTNLAGYDISIGKEIIDLSTSKIFALNDFLSPQLSILDPYDRSLSTMGVEGMSIGTPIEAISSTATVYIYKDRPKGSEQETVVYLAHLKHIEEALTGDVFVGQDKNKQSFLATATSFYIDQQTNMYVEAKKQSNGWGYIVGLDYSIPGIFSLAVERLSKSGSLLGDVFSTTHAGVLQSSKESNVSDDVVLDRITNRADFANGTLLGGEYFGIFARFPLKNNVTCNTLFQYSLGDEAHKISIQAESKAGSLKGYLEYTNTFGTPTHNEYALGSQHTLLINISFDAI